MNKKGKSLTSEHIKAAIDLFRVEPWECSKCGMPRLDNPAVWLIDSETGNMVGKVCMKCHLEATSE